MRSKPLYHEVSKEIMDLIRTSDFPIGCRLPSVRDLATKFGVCSAVIRQALIALEARGVLFVKDGSGTYVSHKFKFNSYGSPDFASFELIETLALVETDAVAFAAPIISRESVLELEKLDEIISNEDRRGITNIQAHSAFHNLIVRSTNNEVLILMTETLWDVQKDDSKLRRTFLEVFNSNNEYLKEERLAILAALKCRDSDGARKAMRAYFNRIMEALLATSEERAYQEVKSKTSITRSRFLLSTQLSSW